MSKAKIGLIFICILSLSGAVCLSQCFERFFAVFTSSSPDSYRRWSARPVIIIDNWKYRSNHLLCDSIPTAPFFSADPYVQR